MKANAAAARASDLAASHLALTEAIAAGGLNADAFGETLAVLDSLQNQADPDRIGQSSCRRPRRGGFFSIA